MNESLILTTEGIPDAVGATLSWSFGDYTMTTTEGSELWNVSDDGKRVTILPINCEPPCVVNPLGLIAQGGFLTVGCCGYGASIFLLPARVYTVS